MNADAQMAYAIFWTIYAVAFVLFFYLFSQLLRIIPIYGVRTLIQAALVVLLLTPVESAEAVNWWIPAWLHGGYEGILGRAEESVRAFSNVALAGGCMLIVWILDLVRVRIWRRR
ncbi:hypothetical protein [Marinobacter fonticola]|uniref:hypothetical protein n=1 Tax=Marinobacter fonticola TaxID=2603215 RepID=UPI0011E75765|nr:hypothetical protein [Marinobacter fonticola]